MCIRDSSYIPLGPRCYLLTMVGSFHPLSWLVFLLGCSTAWWVHTVASGRISATSRCSSATACSSLLLIMLVGHWFVVLAITCLVASITSCSYRDIFPIALQTPPILASIITVIISPRPPIRGWYSPGLMIIPVSVRRWGIRTPTPVSYTHLDVYKRQ